MKYSERHHCLKIAEPSRLGRFGGGGGGGVHDLNTGFYFFALHKTSMYDLHFIVINASFFF